MLQFQARKHAVNWVALLLCAGLGTRLRPVTTQIPKPLCPLGDRPLVGHAVNQLRAAGIRQFAFNAFHLSQRVEAYVAALARDDEHMTCVVETELLGTAGGVRGLHAGQAFALVWNGDIYAPDLDIAALCAVASEEAPTLVVARARAARGTVGLDDVENIVRLRDQTFGDERLGVDYIGIAVLPRRFIETLPAHGCLVADGLIPWLAAGEPVFSFVYEGHWSDGGTLAQYLEQNLEWLRRQEPPTRAYLGRDVSRVPGVDVEDSVVGQGAQLEGHGALRRCVVLPGARAKAPLENAIVFGEDVLPIGATSSPELDDTNRQRVPWTRSVPRSVVVREVNVPAAPMTLARRVWRPGSVCLWSADASGPSFIGVHPVAQSSALDPEEDLAWRDEDSTFGWVPRWFGVLPYEAQRARCERQRWSKPDVRPPPLLDEQLWVRYAVVVAVTDRVYVIGEDEAAVDDTVRRMGETPAAPTASIRRQLAGSGDRERQLAAQESRHRGMVEEAIRSIRAGDVYQVNLARRLDFDVQGDALALLALMSETVPAPFAAAFDLPSGVGVASTSPELLLSTDTRRQVLTVPIKGTRPRSGESSLDATTASELERDVKERAELAMVVDVERNDVGRIAEFGSVVAETPRVLPFSTVFHRLARVRGVARKDVSRTELLEAMLPSGSVTGAPKVRAMELIAQWEEHRRGLYTGALGYITRDGCLRLSMAIRCLVSQGGVGHYHVGGGIVVKSDPERELQETFWKAEQVLRTSSS